MRWAGGRAGRRAALGGALLLGGVSLAACGGAGRGGAGRLEATWTGSDKGRMSGTATAIWCRDARIAQLTAVRGDTGMGLLIHPAESLAPGRYPIVEPAAARTTAPAAALGLRLVGTTAVVGYQGRSGTVTLERVARGRLSGRFDAKATVATAAAGSVTVDGRFRDVPVATGGAECPR